MLLFVLIFFPLFAAFVALLAKAEAVKKIALAASIIELGLSVAAYQSAASGGAMDLWSVNLPWIRSLGIQFHAGLDGISLLMVLLTNLLVPFIIYSSFDKNYARPHAFYFLVLAMQMALIGVFTALDGFLFYTFWELALLPIYFICLLWGGENRSKITFKFFLYTLSGSLLMLAALIYVYLHTPANHSFDINALYDAGKNLAEHEQNWVFGGMFIAFGIKMPVFPFHTWQPDTYAVAPTQGTMLLSGIMLKMGTYGLIRWLIPLVPRGVYYWSDTVVTLAIFGIVYASCIAIFQKDMKRLIAYSSIAHVGLIAAGIMTTKTIGLQGSLVQMFSHGINVVGLFFVCDIISNRTGAAEMRRLGGIRSLAPDFAVLFLVILLGSVALPLTNGFVGEFLLLNSLFQFQASCALFAGLTIILGAVYMLRSYQTVMLGETSAQSASFAPLTVVEKTTLVLLAALILFFGIFPNIILQITEPAVQLIMQKYKAGLS